jgi:hypothetical protein
MDRRQRKPAAPQPARLRSPGRRRPAPDLARPGACALCGREARGFGYVHRLLWGRYPHYCFCSKACLDSGSGRAARNNGMIDKSEMEIHAIKHAREYLAEVLTAMDLIAPFYDRSAAEIDKIIEACVDGFQEGMQLQAPKPDPFQDPIPF